MIDDANIAWNKLNKGKIGSVEHIMGLSISLARMLLIYLHIGHDHSRMRSLEPDDQRTNLSGLSVFKMAHKPSTGFFRHFSMAWYWKGKAGHFINPKTMWKNYLTIAWRNLIKNKGYALINIIGLALGMTIAMLIGLWVYDESSFINTMIIMGVSPR